MSHARTPPPVRWLGLTLEAVWLCWHRPICPARVDAPKEATPPFESPEHGIAQWSHLVSTRCQRAPYPLVFMPTRAECTEVTNWTLADARVWNEVKWCTLGMLRWATTPNFPPAVAPPLLGARSHGHGPNAAFSSQAALACPAKAPGPVSADSGSNRCGYGNGPRSYCQSETHSQRGGTVRCLCPRAMRNITLRPAASGEKNSVTASSKNVSPVAPNLWA